MYVNNSLKSLLLVFLISGWCLAMEKAAPIPAESQERVIVPFPDGLYQSAPPDLKRLLLEYILALETNSSVFPKVGELRGVSRQWRGFLHDPKLLKKVFRRCQYPQTVRNNPAVLGCLGSYVGSLVAKTERTPFDRDFIDMLRLNTWDFNDLLSSLVMGPHCTIATLRSNPDLLQTVLASFMHLLATSTASSEENPSQPSKVATLSAYCGIYLNGILTDESLMSTFAPLLQAVAGEVMETLPADQSAKVREMLGTLNVSPTSSEKLSYGPLVRLMEIYLKKPCEFKALECGQLVEIIKAKCTLSKEERAFLADVCNGQNAQCIERVKEKQVLTPELLDIALVLAAKAGNVSLVRSFMEMTEGVVRPDTSMMMLGLVGRQLLKLDHQLLMEFFDYVYAVLIKPHQHSLFVAVSATSLFCMVESFDELEVFCTCVDKLYEKMEIQDRLLKEWLQACFTQDEVLITKGLSELTLADDRLSPVQRVNCMRHLNYAICIAQINDLRRTKERLLTSEFGPLVKHAFDQLLQDVQNEGVFVLMQKMHAGDTGVESLLKPYWVDSVIHNVGWGREEQLLFEAIMQGDDSLPADLVVVSCAQKPLLLEMLLLSALRHGKCMMAAEIFKNNFTKYPKNHPEAMGQDFLLRWASLYALQQGNEELWNGIKEYCPRGRRELYKVCACGSLSRQGFRLASKEYLELGRERDEAMLYSQEWVEACWDEDSSLLQRLNVKNIDEVFLTWACKSGRLTLVKYFLTKDYVRIYIEENLNELMHCSPPEIAAYLRRMTNKVTLKLVDNEVETVTEEEWDVFKKLLSSHEMVMNDEGNIDFGRLTGHELYLLRKHLAVLNEGGQALQDLLEHFFFSQNVSEIYDGCSLLDAVNHMGIECLRDACKEYCETNLPRIIKQGRELIRLITRVIPVERIFLLAAEMGEEEIVSLLLVHGVPVDVVDDKGETALCRASRAGQLAVVKLLLVCGADLSQSEDPGTPLYNAVKFGEKNVEALLRAHILNQKKLQREQLEQEQRREDRLWYMKRVLFVSVMYLISTYLFHFVR